VAEPIEKLRQLYAGWERGDFSMSELFEPGMKRIRG